MIDDFLEYRSGSESDNGSFHIRSSNEMSATPVRKPHSRASQYHDNRVYQYVDALGHQGKRIHRGDNDECEPRVVRIG